MPDKSIIVRVSPEMAKELRAQRELSGVPTSEFIRRAIRLAQFGDAQNKRESRIVGSPAPVLFPNRETR
jgi:Arc/MetJ-type ribon-helix-helix transcriptional regulator